MRKLVLAVLILGFGLVGLQAQASANLLSDPGFELGGSAVEIKDGPWTWSGGSNGAAFYNNTAARSGSKSAKTVIWGGLATDYAYFNEDFTGIDFGVPYVLSGYFQWKAGSEALDNGNLAKLQVKWFDSLDPAASPLRTDESTAFTNAYAASTWHLLSVTTPVAPAGAIRAAAVLALTTNNSYVANSAIYTDDMSFNPVPEPASMILLGSGILGLFGLTRKKS
jgi:hypothetical protein